MPRGGLNESRPPEPRGAILLEQKWICEEIFYSFIAVMKQNREGDAPFVVLFDETVERLLKRPLVGCVRKQKKYSVHQSLKRSLLHADPF